MKKLAIFKHKKQFAKKTDVVELIVNDCEYLIRLKYGSMKNSIIYKFDNSTKARYEFTKICLFILS